MDNPSTPTQVLSFAAPLNSTQITLQVGERRFVTMKDTLTSESGFFAALLSGRWDNAQADGSYFIDADPKLFEHILHYLRRSVLPVFYDNAKGHDYALYHALLEEAKYFQILRLENWLKKKEYLKAIKISYSVYERDDIDGYSQVLGADEQVEFHPTWRKKQVYICPRGISLHRDNRSACGRQCMNAQGDGGIRYEEEQVREALMIRKKTCFNPEALTEE